MKKFEYLVMEVHKTDEFVIERDLDVLGEDGWEMVSADGGFAYFKREIFDAPCIIPNDPPVEGCVDLDVVIGHPVLKDCDNCGAGSECAGCCGMDQGSPITFGENYWKPNDRIS